VAAIESARSSASFDSLGDLDRRVKGIGPAISSSLKPHLRFPSPSP
jgi:DNA uptake protein ComE-like DNA-binding protein